jgi:hypothetical protein
MPQEKGTRHVKWIKASEVPLPSFRDGMRVKFLGSFWDPAMSDGDSVLYSHDGHLYMLTRHPRARSCDFSWIPKREPRRYGQKFGHEFCLSAYGDNFLVAFPLCPKRKDSA